MIDVQFCVTDGILSGDIALPLERACNRLSTGEIFKLTFQPLRWQADTTLESAGSAITLQTVD